MPFILGILGIIAAAYFWSQRARNAAAITQDLAGMASDVMNAARRFGFTRRANQHAVDGVDDPSLAVAAVGIGFLELGGLPSREEQNALIISLQHQLGMDHAAADEAAILGRWLMTECGGAAPGIDRVTRRLWKLQGAAGFQPLMQVLGDIGRANPRGLSDPQKEALAAIARAFRLN